MGRLRDGMHVLTNYVSLWAGSRGGELALGVFLIVVFLVAIAVLTTPSIRDRVEELAGQASDTVSDVFSPAADGGAGAADSGTGEGAAAPDSGPDDAATGGGGAGSTGAASSAVAPEVLGLAARVADTMAEYNDAAGADDHKAQTETALAIKPLVTDFIEAGGGVQMPDFMRAIDKWIAASSRFVNGDAGAVAELEAAHAEAVRALAAHSPKP